jgi:hypothetical protein
MYIYNQWAIMPLLYRRKTMALRKIQSKHRLIDTRIEVKIFRDSEWDEYVVKCYTSGVLKSSYHTSDKEDAEESAKHMLDEAHTALIETRKLARKRSKDKENAVDFERWRERTNRGKNK